MASPSADSPFASLAKSSGVLVIEQLQKRGERLGIGVVRRRSQEELVLEVRREEPNESCPQALDGRVLADGRRNVMRLVYYQQVEAAWERRVRRKYIAQQTDTF